MSKARIIDPQNVLFGEIVTVESFEGDTVLVQDQAGHQFYVEAGDIVIEPDEETEQ